MIDVATLREEAKDILTSKGYKVEEFLNVLTINDNVEIEGLFSDYNLSTLIETQNITSSGLAQIIVDQYEYATREL